MKDKIKKAVLGGLIIGSSMLFPLAARAEVDYSTTFTVVGTEATNAINAVLPIAVPVLAIIIGVGVGIKVIRRVTGR